MKPRTLQLTCTVFNDLVPNSHRTNCLHYKYKLANVVKEINPLRSDSHTKYGNEIYGEGAIFCVGRRGTC